MAAPQPARWVIGATVYVRGRRTRTRRSEYNRPETLAETADLVTRAGRRRGTRSVRTTG